MMFVSQNTAVGELNWWKFDGYSMNLLRPFKFQLALIALLCCKLNEATKLILKQKVDQSQPDFAILHQG
jgi:hypothetical protein